MTVLCRPSPSANEIIDGKVWLGNLSACLDVECRTNLGITHIVSVCGEAHSTGGNHLAIPVQDQEYEDILAHIPKAVAFIEQALEEGGRVLVHCQMGVSRSATVVAAYLMKSREIDVIEALEIIKTRRREIHPNYGFFKQLEIYGKCSYDPKPRNPVYRSWKRRYAQDVTRYLAYVEDVASIIPDRLAVMSDFPEDTQQRRWLLQEFGITHLVVVGNAGDVADAGPNVRILEVLEQQDEEAWTRVAVSGACRAIKQAIEGDGRVMVYSKNETKACVLVCGYLMASRRMSSTAALAEVEKYLPLFTPSASCRQQLGSLDAMQLEDKIETPSIVPKEKRSSFSKHLVIPTTLSAFQEKAKERLQTATFQSPQLRMF